MIQNFAAKILFSSIILITFFMGQGIASIGIVVGCIFLINELIQKRAESIGIFFLLMYLYIGIKPISAIPFQYIDDKNQEGENRGVQIFTLPVHTITINFGSFEVSLSFIVGIFFFSYLTYVSIYKPSLLSGLPKLLIILFLLAFIPSIIGFLIANSKGVNGSLAATKTLLGLSVVFFGYIFAKEKSSEIYKIFFLLKKRYIYVLAFLQLVGLMYNHILFIYIGIAASIAVYVLLIEKNIFKFLVLLLSIFLSSIYNTFTIILIPLVSGLITFFFLKNFTFRIRDMLPKIGFVFYFLFLFFILSVPQQQISLHENASTEGRLYNKIFGDRYFIWSGYIEDIKEENPFFIVPKEAIKFDTVYETETTSSIGAHNSLIQLLYYYGVVLGSILFLILFFIINKMIVSSKFLPLHIQAIALGLFSVFIVFGLTGHSIITHDASLFFWLFVGLITGLGEQMKLVRIQYLSNKP
jgi:hypothetical protein